MSETRELDKEGLQYLRWSQFDSPDNPGSGYRFMERDTVLILDMVVHKTKMNLNIILGYVTPKYARLKGMVSTDSHRIGKAVRIRILEPKKRGRLVKALHELGVKRVAVDHEMVYFDTDNQKPEMMALWC